MPHAWPAAYAISLPVQKIMGLGISRDGIVVVMTDYHASTSSTAATPATCTPSEFR